LIEKYIKKYSDTVLSNEFIIFEEQMKKALNRLGPILQNIDSNLQSALKKTEDQIDNSLKKLRLRSNQAFETKMEVEVRQLNKIVNNFFPQGSLQERKINLLYFLIKYGPEFVENLKSSVSLDHFSHQLVFI
jgi:uncharacterized protein YllA (UPF0747 family)